MSTSPLKFEHLRAPQLAPPRFEQGKQMLIAGLRGHFTTATWNGIPAQWQRLLSFGRLPHQNGNVYYGLCFLVPEGVDYLCGAEVEKEAGLPPDFVHVTIPAQTYAVFQHHGHVSTLRDTMEAIEHNWQPEYGRILQAAAGIPNFFERYGEKFNPQTGTGDIEVWIPSQS